MVEVAVATAIRITASVARLAHLEESAPAHLASAALTAAQSRSEYINIKLSG